MLKIVPLTLRQANALVGDWHRHHRAVVGHRWAVGVKRDGQIVGAAIVGRPVARMTPQYDTAEVTRLVTNGAKNGCSILYAACARAAQAMGFEQIQTFILETESGVSLRAAGWTADDELTDGGEWDRAARHRKPADQTVRKRRYYRILNGAASPEPRDNAGIA